MIAAGLEYGIPIGGYELTAFAEYQTVYGLSSDFDEEDKENITVFQEDAAVGLQFKFNDLQSKLIKVLAIVDLQKTSEVLGSISYEQRIGSQFKVRGGYRLVNAPPEDPEKTPVGLEKFHQSGYGFLQLTWFF
jgi:hypothetical protein